MAEVTGGGTTMARAAALVFCALSAACSSGGGGGDDSGGGFQISPASVTVPAGGSVQFSGAPSGSTTWSVDNVPGGSLSKGTISAAGLYLAPLEIPTPNTVADDTVTVTAQGASNSATVRLVTRFEVSSAFPVFPACTGAACPKDFPTALAVADFNHDGRSDVMTANTGSGTVSVLRAESPLSLTLLNRYDVGNQTTSPQALVAPDVNADLSPDLAVADTLSPDPSSPAVRTRLGQGNGMFGSEQTTTLPTQPTISDPLAIAAGYFNGGSERDLVVASYLNSTLIVLLGNGLGQFQVLTPLSFVDLKSPLGVAAADFNRDGIDDVVLASSGNGKLVVLLNNGSGAFPTPEAYDVSGSPSAVAVAYLNGDSYPDLLVTDPSSDTLTTFLNRGTPGSPTFQVGTTGIKTGREPVSLAVADFNRDGAVDVAVVNHQSGGLDPRGTVAVYFGNNDGTLNSSDTYQVGEGPQAVATGDFDIDGWPDLAVVNSDDKSVILLRNRGAPTSP